MRFSTKAEYGLKAAVNLAMAYPNQKTSKEISQEEEISLKYLERLLNVLGSGGILESQKGKTGGYVLASKPASIKVGDVIELLEGPILPMRCAGQFCAAEKNCPSSKVWIKLGDQIRKTLYSMSLNDLIKK